VTAADQLDDLALAEEAPRDPSLRWGWVMAVVWLVFLGFPIAAVVADDDHWAWRATSVTLILTFAAVYVHGFVRLSRSTQWQDVVRWGWKYVAALTILMAGATAISGFATLGMTPFVISMGMFVLPLAGSFAVFGGCLVMAVVSSAMLGEGAWFLPAIVILVGGATAAARLLERAGARHRALTENLAITTERERVARDVHDVLGHSLTVVSVKAELAERLVDTDPERAKSELDQIQQLTRQALAEIRATVGGLRVARLTDQIDASRRALEDAGITAELPIDPSVVEPRHRVVLAWALREAVTNVVRHSSARTCSVRLGSDWLTVLDDGRGVSGRREGNGLRGLRERVRAAGGTLSVSPGPEGAGTELRVQL
jgi:two-component system sensor histidine kinase DesK